MMDSPAQQERRDLQGMYHLMPPPLKKKKKKTKTYALSSAIDTISKGIDSINNMDDFKQVQTELQQILEMVETKVKDLKELATRNGLKYDGNNGKKCSCGNVVDPDDEYAQICHICEDTHGKEGALICVECSTECFGCDAILCSSCREICQSCCKHYFCKDGKGSCYSVCELCKDMLCNDCNVIILDNSFEEMCNTCNKLLEKLRSGQSNETT